MGIATSDPYEYVEEAGSTRLRVWGTRALLRVVQSVQHAGSLRRCSRTGVRNTG